MKKKEKESVRTLRMKDEVYKKLVSRAKAKYQSVSALIRYIVDEWLENNPLNFPPQP
jgi:predicted CopG family antitoxin